MRNSIAVIVACFVCIVGARPVRADDAQALRKAIAANSPIWVRAPLDANPKMLGAGYDERFSSYDAEGQAHRIFAAKHAEAEIDRYDVQFVQIDDALKLQAAANYLFASAGIQSTTDRRYVWMQVYHLTKVASLERAGPPKPGAKLVAEKIYFGFAFNVIISGSSSTFTADVAAKLRSAGGSLSTFAEKHSLEIKYLTDGLKLKPGQQVPLVPDADQVLSAFVEGKPQPIFVEFLPLQEMFTTPIDWARAKLMPGRYRLSRIDLTIADSKSDGRGWDALGGPPDPMVFAYLDGKTKDNLCFAQDRHTASFTPDKTFELVEGAKIKFEVWDKDMSEHDYAGETVEIDLLKVGAPFQQIDIGTTGQLRSFSIVLEPVN